jgi:hypothetical protein
VPSRATPRNQAELIGSDNPYTSALFNRYKGLRMLQPANLQLTTPPQRTAPHTSQAFHANVYRTKNRSIRAWQDYQDHSNVLIQRQSEFPGVPTFEDTAVSTYQRDFAAGRPVHSAYSKSTQVRPPLRAPRPPARSSARSPRRAVGSRAAAAPLPPPPALVRAQGGGGFGATGSSLHAPGSMTATSPNVRVLHTSHGTRITRSQHPLDRDYGRDPVAKMIWTSGAGWSNPPSHS